MAGGWEESVQRGSPNNPKGIACMKPRQFWSCNVFHTQQVNLRWWVKGEWYKNGMKVDGLSYICYYTWIVNMRLFDKPT